MKYYNMNRHILQIPYYSKNLKAAQQKLPVDLICFAVEKLEKSCSFSSTAVKVFGHLFFFLAPFFFGCFSEFKEI